MLLKRGLLRSALKATVVIVCGFGFLWQTLQFYFLYKTYPTVVDIQVSVPSEIDVPGITLCSGTGIAPEAVCKLSGYFCSREKMLMFVDLCKFFPDYCLNGRLPVDFTAVKYQAFTSAKELNQSALDLLRVPLDQFLKCKIVGGGQERDCDTKNVVIGSYYSDTYTPNFCFSLNTLWGDTKKKLQRIKKSERILIEVYIDTSYRNRSAPLETVQRPKYNPLSGSTFQMAIHSQKLSSSPFVSGLGFMGGKKYHIKLKKEEKHLLPPPYQTNCTDYTKDWLLRGGIGPLNQLMVIQECRLNASIKELGCVPYFIDFPHNQTLCKYCEKNCSRITRVGENCTSLLDFYNQPCDSSVYRMAVEEKFVYIIRKVDYPFLVNEENFVLRQKSYNCTFERIFTRQCQTINIELDFDEYEVTNMTYNPKFESLEIFSVIGGYMGMYLGISLVAVYDFLEMALMTFYTSVKNKNSKVKMTNRNFVKAKKNYNYRSTSEFRKRNVSTPVRF